MDKITSEYRVVMKDGFVEELTAYSAIDAVLTAQHRAIRDGRPWAALTVINVTLGVSYRVVNIALREDV